MASHLLFLDFETGGLNGRLDNGKLGMDYYPIFEVALIITDNQLNVVGEPLRLVIHQDENMISRSSEWALNAHTNSGLLDEVRRSEISLHDAEQLIIESLKSVGIGKYDRKLKTGAILAGSSVTFDRTYMICQMPELTEYLHYRQLDVSAINLAVRLFKPDVESYVHKKYLHKALDDIQETIDELKVYKDHLFS
ncbi:TPA: oligoribonuclease [Photobacterium damselae]